MKKEKVVVTFRVREQYGQKQETEQKRCGSKARNDSRKFVLYV